LRKLREKAPSALYIDVKNFICSHCYVLHWKKINQSGVWHENERKHNQAYSHEWPEVDPTFGVFPGVKYMNRFRQQFKKKETPNQWQNERH
jgi:hypothetical protein